MKILVLLTCILLIRLGSIVLKPKHYTWYSLYLEKIDAYITKPALRQGSIAGIISLAAIMVPFAVVYFISCVNPVFKFLTSVLILWFAFDASDFTAKNIKQNRQNNTEFSNNIFWQAHEKVFAIIFWFLILGPLGALFYRFLSLTEEISSTNSQFAEYNYVTTLIHKYLSWPSSALTAIGFGLGGDLVKTLGIFLQTKLNPNLNQELVISSGNAALNFAEDAEMQGSKYAEALALIERTGLIWVAILAIVEIAVLI